MATPFFSLPMPAPFQFSLSGGSAISTSTLLETSRAVAQALPVNLSVAGTEHNSATSSRNRQMTGDQPLPVVRDGGIVSIAAGCPYGYSDVDCSGIDRAYLRLEAGADETALNHAIEIAIGDADNQACWGGCVIDLRELGELTLTGSLDMIPSFGHNIWLLGDPGNTKINGNQYQILSINDSDVNGFLAFFGVEFTNGSVWGGNGSEGGGGGLGAGGALFINQGSVIIDHSKFSNNLARGGDSIGTAPKAPDSKGDGYTNTGEGGRFNYGNNGQKAQFHPFMGGDGGGGGIRGSGGAGRNGKKGNRGQWGSGGGGGGSGSSADSGGSDAGG
ncbi:MAG: hypothetical protein O7D86_05250, partial [Proteobacteria bacterium]|nr:hypothetical protein [Pseudomonadota bacterium]